MAILKQNEAEFQSLSYAGEHGISSASFYKWRSKYCGMDTSLMKRMKGLEEENRRLKKCMPKSVLKLEIRLEAFGGKALKPSLRKEMAQEAIIKHAISIRLACLCLGISESCFYYQSKLNAENEQIAEG